MGKGQIIILNGAPRSGKSSMVRLMQETFPGAWMNLGVDIYVKEVIPPAYRPGIGLRPGGERPDLEPFIVQCYRALYRSIAAHSECGLNVVVDIGHHDSYSKSLSILPECARLLLQLPVIFVGVRCSLPAIMARRRQLSDQQKQEYIPLPDSGAVPPPVELWQSEVHIPGIYDLEVDTSHKSSLECVREISDYLLSGKQPTALQRLAAM